MLKTGDVWAKAERPRDSRAPAKEGLIMDLSYRYLGRQHGCIGTTGCRVLRAPSREMSLPEARDIPRESVAECRQTGRVFVLRGVISRQHAVAGPRRPGGLTTRRRLTACPTSHRRPLVAQPGRRGGISTRTLLLRSLGVLNPVRNVFWIWPRAHSYPLFEGGKVVAANRTSEDRITPWTAATSAITRCRTLVPHSDPSSFQFPHASGAAGRTSR